MNRQRFLLTLAVVLFFATFPSNSFADATLPALLADHMVLQRGMPVHVWGNAAPGESVAVTFRGETKTATTSDLGRWSLFLSPGEAGGPFSLVVKATNTITLNDVLVGDVWVASGQSNMELPMTRNDNSAAEIAAAKYPRIRLFQVKKTTAEYPMEDVEAKSWEACTPETVADSSAAAYFFAREIQQRTGVPIGLIESYWGGSAAESWTSLKALGADAALMPVFAVRAKQVDHHATDAREDAKAERESAQAKAEGKPEPARRWHGPFEWSPGSLYNAMVAPLTPYAIRGVIWYQGESNGGKDRAYLYARLFQTMIRDWRHAWGEGDFPFLYVQLAPWKGAADGEWQVVRDAQRQTLALRNTAMAVIVDVGDPDNLHPTDKQDVGARLALAARSIAYGEKIEYSGPLFRQVTHEEHGLRIWFDHGNGLVAKGGELKGFEVAGSDGKYSPAEAKLDGATVLVSSPTVPDPISVRYGWAAAPDGNLFNREGLPASPFQSEE